MQIEIEAKIKVAELGEFVKRLEGLEGKLLSKGIQRDFYFDRAAASLQSAGCGLRLRQETDDSKKEKKLFTYEYVGIAGAAPPVIAP